MDSCTGVLYSQFSSPRTHPARACLILAALLALGFPPLGQADDVPGPTVIAVVRDGPNPAPEADEGDRRVHRIAGRIAVIASLFALLTAGAVLTGMYSRAEF